MCIFAYPIKRVSNTTIMVAPLGNGKQFTLYQNTAKTEGENVMFLPFPTGECYPIDTTSFSTLLEECERFFEKHHEGGGFGGLRSMAFGTATKEAPLPVQRVGGYRVSIAPTLADIARLSGEVFKVPANIQELLAKNYGQGFGFLVCLFSHTVQAHPIAYVTNRMPGTGHLFIPTMHAHGEPEQARTVTTDGRAIHMGIHCDGCQAVNIVGPRWQCSDCADFDYCDECYQANRKTHGASHVFLHHVEPAQVKAAQHPPRFNLGNYPDGESGRRRGGGDGFITWGFETFPGGGGGGGRASGSPDDWDHTLFIANGQLNVPRFKYDESETQNIQLVGTGFTDRMKRMLGPQLGAILPELQYMTKVSIVGEGYGNFDYSAVEYQMN